MERENDILKSKPLVWDVTCATSDLCPSIDMDDEPNVCSREEGQVEGKGMCKSPNFVGASCDVKKKGFLMKIILGGRWCKKWDMKEKD